jgi:tetratricopeptide (TPR) repeat protein
VRAWRLVVDSAGHTLSDVTVLRLRNESLLYFETDESHHDVDVPWGRNEEISVVLTAARDGGLYTVTFLGPPRQNAPASYSYKVNRALEAFATGDGVAAERLCEEALREDSQDAVARVLLAGFLRDRHFYDRAALLIEEALALDLPPDMRNLANQLSEEISRLQTPVEPAIQNELEQIESQLAAGDAAAAVATCDAILSRRESLSAEARSEILQKRGGALHALGRHFEAIDSFTQALTITRSREDQAIIYFRMAQLFLDMDNRAQAEGAFNIALQYGLPPGLEQQALEALRQLTRNRE